MQEINLFCTGRQKYRELQVIEGKYIQKIKRFIKFEIRHFKEIKLASEDQVKKKESENILKTLAISDFVVILDQRGNQMSSIEFANFLADKVSYFSGKMVFIIGGFAGFDPVLDKRADLRLSFSEMTMAHDIFRIVFLEQLYRAFTIIKGIKYHR